MIKFILNNKKTTYRGPLFKRLVDVLREDFGLTGAKEGCGEGECGACTVLVDGEAVCSCLIPICQVEGSRIETVESLGRPGRLNRLQEGFLAKGGTQCGICTPGMLMTATAWLRSGAKADPLSVRKALAGNLCRCTGYQHIVQSVMHAARKSFSARAVPTSYHEQGVSPLSWYRAHRSARYQRVGTTHRKGGPRARR